MSALKRFKEVSLTLRGFDVLPQDVEKAVGRAGARTGTVGLPVKPGVKTLLKRSFVKYAIEMTSSDSLRDSIHKLFESVGGCDNIKRACEAIRPEFVELNIYLPVRNSDEQEGGIITSDIIELLAQIRCSLTIEL